MAANRTAVVARQLYDLSDFVYAIPLSAAAVDTANCAFSFTHHNFGWPRFASVPAPEPQALACLLLTFFLYTATLARFARGKSKYFRSQHPTCFGHPIRGKEENVFVDLLGVYTRASVFWILSLHLADVRQFLVIYMLLMLIDLPFLGYAVFKNTQVRKGSGSKNRQVTRIQSPVIFAANRWLYNNTLCAMLLSSILDLHHQPTTPFTPLLALGLFVCLANSIIDLLSTSWIYDTQD